MQVRYHRKLTTIIVAGRVSQAGVKRTELNLGRFQRTRIHLDADVYAVVLTLLQELYRR